MKSSFDVSDPASMAAAIANLQRYPGGIAAADRDMTMNAPRARDEMNSTYQRLMGDQRVNLFQDLRRNESEQGALAPIAANLANDARLKALNSAVPVATAEALAQGAKRRFNEKFGIPNLSPVDMMIHAENPASPHYKTLRGYREAPANIYSSPEFRDYARFGGAEAQEVFQNLTGRKVDQYGEEYDTQIKARTADLKRTEQAQEEGYRRYGEGIFRSMERDPRTGKLRRLVSVADDSSDPMAPRRGTREFADLTPEQEKAAMDYAAFIGAGVPKPSPFSQRLAPKPQAALAHYANDPFVQKRMQAMAEANGMRVEDMTPKMRYNLLNDIISGGEHPSMRESKWLNANPSTYLHGKLNAEEQAAAMTGVRASVGGGMMGIYRSLPSEETLFGPPIFEGDSIAAGIGNYNPLSLLARHLDHNFRKPITDINW